MIIANFGLLKVSVPTTLTTCQLCVQKHVTIYPKPNGLILHATKTMEIETWDMDLKLKDLILTLVETNAVTTHILPCKMVALVIATTLLELLKKNTLNFLTMTATLSNLEWVVSGPMLSTPIIFSPQTKSIFGLDQMETTTQFQTMANSSSIVSKLKANGSNIERLR